MIGTAIGVLMCRHFMDEVEAFAVLVRTSRDADRKLEDVATELVGTAPTRPGDGSSS